MGTSSQGSLGVFTSDGKPFYMVRNVTFQPYRDDGLESILLSSIKKEPSPPKPSSITIPQVKRVVYNDPATIIIWEDGTKTVVKCMDGEPFEKYAGFCAALARKVFGNTTKAKKVAGAKEKHAKVKADEITNLESIIEEIGSGSISCGNIDGLSCTSTQSQQDNYATLTAK